MEKLWIIADIPVNAYELLSMVSGKGGEITAFVCGDQAVAQECFSYGATSVNLLPLPENTTWEQYVKAVSEEAKKINPELIMVAATRRGKTFSAQLAALLDLPYLSEIKTLELEDNLVLGTRNIFGGLAEKVLEIEHPAILSVTPGICKPEKTANSGSGEVKTMSLAEDSGITVVERKKKEASSVNLKDAELVVGVGRGIENEEKLKLAKELASILGGEIGCSRPVAEDLHLVEEERYIGISGQVLNPNIYLALGISGQVQHIYGVRDAKTIVSIDKNENAPIFKVSDYYIVGDLNELLPELISSLK